jgi:hypothetical protein
LDDSLQLGHAIGWLALADARLEQTSHSASRLVIDEIDIEPAGQIAALSSEIIYMFNAAGNPLDRTHLGPGGMAGVNRSWIDGLATAAVL